jgi:hypothetical protein
MDLLTGIALITSILLKYSPIYQMLKYPSESENFEGEEGDKKRGIWNLITKID